MTWWIFSTGQWRVLNTKINLLMPDDSWETTPWEKSNTIERFEWFAKRHCIIEKRFMRTKVTLFGEELPCDVGSVTPHIVVLVGNWRTCVPLTPMIASHNGDNFCQPPRGLAHAIHSPPPPYVWLTKEKPFIFVLVPNDFPTWQSRRANSIMPFVGNCFLKSLLSGNPLMAKFGQICHEKGNFRPPPTCLVKE